MASKWAHLRGRVPEKEKTDRQQDVEDKIKEYGNKSADEMTRLFNEKKAAITAKNAEVKVLEAEVEALDVVLRKHLDIEKVDAVRMNGYTWSQKFEPYPIAEDPAAIVKYFEEHGMADQLVLTTSELASRLKNFVKAEADNNELQIEMKTVEGPDGSDIEVTEVRSQIPGVKVFLKSGLSRVKSGKGAQE